MIGKTATLGLLLLAAAAANAQAPVPDQVGAVCTRADLRAAADSYVEAQSTGDVSAMPLAGDAVFLENMSPVARDEGLWNTALPIALSRSFVDDTRCKTFTEIIVTEGGHQYVIGTRLFVDGGEIIRVDSLVTDEGDWLFNANAYLKYSSAEDWSPLPEAQRTPAQDLIDAARIDGAGELGIFHRIMLPLAVPGA